MSGTEEPGRAAITVPRACDVVETSLPVAGNRPWTLNEPGSGLRAFRAMIGSSGGREEAGRVEHVVRPAQRAGRACLRGQEGGGGFGLGRDRRAPGPGSEPPVECPGRNGRCFRLPGAPGPRAGARPSRHGERIGWAAQVAHQGLDQRGEMPPIVPGSDEMRAIRLRDRGRKQSERQERCNGPCRREEQMPGRTRSHHSSGSVDRFPLPLWKGASSLENGARLDPGRNKSRLVPSHLQVVPLFSWRPSDAALGRRLESVAEAPEGGDRT